MGTPFEYRSSYVPYPLPGQEEMAIGCMDDRPGDEQYLQIGGAVYGLAQDRAATMEMVAPGSFDELNMDVHVFAGVITGALAEAKIDGTMHYHCAAFEQADGAVAEALSDSSKLEQLFATAHEIYLPLQLMGETRAWIAFKKGVEAQRKIIETKLAPRERAEYEMFESTIAAEKAPNGLYTTPRRVHLTEPEHKAGDVVFNHAAGFAFNSRQAWDNGNPAYSVSVGGFRDMNQPLEKELGTIPAGAFALAAAARHAAIVSVLPKPAGQEALNVHTIRHL